MNSKSNLRKNPKSTNRPPSIFDNCDDLSDQDLEKELSLLINSSVSYESTYKKIQSTQKTNIQELLKDDIYKDIALNDPKISDSSDIDDNELLAELNQIMEATEDLDMSFEVDKESYDTSQPSPPKKLQTDLPFKTKSEEEIKSKTLEYSASLLNTLNQRLMSYKDALNVAQSNNDKTKSRRLNRGLKLLENMVKETQGAQLSHKPLSFTFEEIPPEVTKGKSTRALHRELNNLDTPKSSDLLIDLSDQNDSRNPLEDKTKSNPSPHLKELEFEFNRNIVDSNSGHSAFDLDAFVSQLLSQQAEFKEQALIAKHGNDLENARTFLKLFKDYQGVIDELLHYKDLNNSQLNKADMNFKNLILQAKQLPTLAQYVTLQTSLPNQENKVSPIKENLQSSSPPHTIKNSEDIPRETQALTSSSQAGPSNFIEELRERMNKYQTGLESAKADDNSSKVRRMTRILKQYQDAIQAYTGGNKNYPYQELPNPPGFPEIPIAKYLGISGARGKPDGVEEESSHDTETREEANNDQSIKETSPSKSTKADYSHHVKQQLEFLYTRQQVFKREALEAKHKGNLTQAKEYLRLMKGFDPLIQACKSGLPIDMNTLPSLPHPSDEIDHPTDRGTTPLVGQTLNQLGPAELREQCDWLAGILNRQIKTCATNARYYVHLGDLSSARNFDEMAAASKRDLTCLEDFSGAAASDKFKMAPVLRYHFETKVLPIVKSNTHLGDNDMELTIVRGYQYGSTANREMDTYVKYDFPYPSASPQRDKTAVVYGTNNPEYDQTFKLSIDRKSRALARCFKRQAIKLEVYLKGGLMRFINGDKLLGSVSLKLAGLEQCATLHECCNLMEGRKEAGGRLEVMVKIRDPLLRKEVEEVREKWLVLDR